MICGTCFMFCMICPTKLDLSDKNDKEPQNMSDKKYFVFCWRFPEKTQIITMRMHQEHHARCFYQVSCTYRHYVAQLPSVLYYVLNTIDV